MVRRDADKKHDDKVSKAIIYYNKTPLKILFLAEIILGTIFLIIFIALYTRDIFLDFWTFAGPLLGLALLIAGLSSSKIKEISLIEDSEEIQINRESLFRSNHEFIKLSDLIIELKSPTGTKKRIFPFLRLVILKNEKEIAELKSGFMSYNNSKLRRTYKALKAIQTQSNMQVGQRKAKSPTLDKNQSPS